MTPARRTSKFTWISKDKQYQIDRFRQLFPAPPRERVTLPKQPIDTLDPTFARLECTKLTFVSTYQGPLAHGRSGWWSWRGTHEVWVSDKVPFGVAALKFTGKSEEWPGEQERGLKATVATTKQLILSASGNGAASVSIPHEVRPDRREQR